MKLFRSKQTGEMYICLTYSKSALSLISLHDESHMAVIGKEVDNYEEVNTAPKRPEPVEMTYEFRKTEQIMFKEIQDNLNNDEPLKDTFGVGDILYVPVQGYESHIPFEIVHVNEENRSLYFMPRDILAQMPMTKADEWLKDFQNKLPPELVDCLKPIEHINANGTYSRLLSLPSEKNMGADENGCRGLDDIPFDKFKDEVSRCKNFNRETRWYWTDTPYVSNSTNFSYVNYSGNVNTGGIYASNSFGVCPCLKLSKGE